MGIKYRIDQKKGITLALWEGLVTAEEFLAHVRRLTSDPDWPPPRRLHFADLRSTSLDASIDEGILETAADLYARRLERLAGMKAAIVAGSLQAYTKAVVVERLADRYGASVIVFNGLDTACTWLGVEVEEVEGALQELRAGLTSGRPGKSPEAGA
jgi:hypothetical protein